MKNAKKIIILFLTVFMMLNIAPVRAADEGFSDGGEIPVYEPGPILEEPEDHSGETVTDDHAEVRLCLVSEAVQLQTDTSNPISSRKGSIGNRNIRSDGRRAS